MYKKEQSGHFLTQLTGIFYKTSSTSLTVQHYYKVLLNKSNGFQKPGKVTRVTTLNKSSVCVFEKQQVALKFGITNIQKPLIYVDRPRESQWENINVRDPRP